MATRETRDGADLRVYSGARPVPDGVLALTRAAHAYRAEFLSWINMAIGVWLFISAFWLAPSAQASWNVGVMGIVVFILGAWSAAATDAGRARRVPRR